MSYSGEGFLMFAQDATGKAVPVAAAATSTGLAALPISTPFEARSDTFTALGAGGTLVAPSGVKSYSIMVKGTGGTASAWNVIVEGSLNNIDFTPILVHTQATGNAVLLATTTALWPALFFRSRVRTLSLGPATNIVVQILGMD